MNRNRLVLLCLSLAGLLCGPQHASGDARLFAVASTEDMADFVRQVGGDRVEAYAVSNGRYDLHFFEPLPSQVMKLRRAELLVVGGLDIDVWIQPMIDASGNPRILFGAPGYVDPAVGVRPLQVPRGRIDGSMGDVHPHGNPHFWFTPENVAIAVDNITEGLCRVDPEGAAFYRARRDAYREEVKRTFEELQGLMSPYRGSAVLQYHPSWDYFCGAFGLRLVGTLEPRPGLPPTPGHLREVVKQARAERAAILLVEPYYPRRPVNFVVRQTGVASLRLPLYLGGKEGIDTYLENLRYLVETVAAALRERTPP